jgi:mRNA-degrading endonuclease RelE of RelBE toxin-antitoxin system
MWHILEHRTVPKKCKNLPPQILKKYELWKDLVFRHGPQILKEFSGFEDEPLIGDRLGQRSSRLNIKYRVIYTVNGAEVTVYVLEVTPHKY